MGDSSLTMEEGGHKRRMFAKPSEEFQQMQLPKPETRLKAYFHSYTVHENLETM
jgi:hypothetical protein